MEKKVGEVGENLVYRQLFEYDVIQYFSLTARSAEQTILSLWITNNSSWMNIFKTRDY